MKIILLQTVIILKFIFLTRSDDQDLPRVSVDDGILKGAKGLSRDKRSFNVFEGIPYAISERFKLSEPVKPWEGVLDVRKNAKMCPQTFGGGMAVTNSITGVENCLSLNVYSPDLKPTKPLPVMVWIHGGCFMFGAGSDYNPTYFMDEDIVLVTINYRLGVLGFLYLEDDSIPGNLGLRDQVLALKWVQRNIKNFGGDSDLVTIFGQSAGGASVHHHILSPMSQGLFHRAIAQSGSAAVWWGLTKHPRRQAEKFAASLGCSISSSVEIIECLKKVDFNKIIDEQSIKNFAITYKYYFLPVLEVDKIGNAGEAFITTHPNKLMEEKRVANPVPLITGVVKNEASIFTAVKIVEDLEGLEESEYYQELSSNWTNIAPDIFMYSSLDVGMTPRKLSASKRIRDFYIGNLDVSGATEQRLTDALSDLFFNHGIYYTALKHSEVAPTFVYRFTFNDGFSFLHLADYYLHDPPTHFDDVLFQFPHMLRFGLDTKKEIEFSKKFIKLWVSFAKTGRPEAAWGFGGKVWPPVNKTEKPFSWYKIDTNPQLLAHQFNERFQFWDDLLSTDLSLEGAF